MKQINGKTTTHETNPWARRRKVTKTSQKTQAKKKQVEKKSKQLHNYSLTPV